MEDPLFQNVKIGCKIPYKPVDYEDLWSRFRKTDHNGAKSIRFFTKSDIGFHQVEKPYKNLSKMMVLRWPKPRQVKIW